MLQGKRVYQKKETFQMEYGYYLDNGEGTILFNNLPVKVLPLANNRPPDDRLRCLIHENLLLCLYIDHTNKNIIYEHFSDYVQDMSTLPLLTYEIPNYHWREKIEYTYTSDEHRSIFRSMVRFVCFLHHQGFCLQPISKETLVLVNGQLKFQGISILEITDDGQTEDFKQVATVITSLLEHKHKGVHEDQFPADLRDFLKCLGRFNPKGKKNGMTVQMQEDFFQNHIAVLSTKERINRIEKYGNREFNDVEDDKSLVNFIGWDVAFLSNSWGPVHNVFRYRFSNYDNSLISFLEFGKNLCKHLDTELRKYKNNFTLKDKELCIMAAMDKKIAKYESDIFELQIFRELIR